MVFLKKNGPFLAIFAVSRGCCFFPETAFSRDDDRGWRPRRKAAGESPPPTGAAGGTGTLAGRPALMAHGLPGGVVVFIIWVHFAAAWRGRCSGFESAGFRSAE